MTEPQATDMLLHHPLFDGVSAQRLKSADIQPRHRTYAPRQVILDRGDPAREVHLLVSGRAIAVHWTQDGRELAFDRFGPGTYYGELAALDGGERSLAVYAQRETDVLALDVAHFRRAVDALPEVRNRVITRLTQLVRSLTDRQFEGQVMTVEMRVRRYIARLALEAGEIAAGGVLEEVPTHFEIANTVGANREAVSRAMSALKRGGVIAANRKQVTILDPDALMGDG